MRFPIAWNMSLQNPAFVRTMVGSSTRNPELVIEC
jgi:hypothetical protein